MDAVKEKQSYVFDRKLTDEEIRELIDNFDYAAYEAEAYADDSYEPGPIWDRYGNPTRDTIAAMYEDKHDIGDTLTWEEFCDELKELYEETEPCVNLDSETSLRAI